MIGYTNIPVQLCEYALVNRKTNQLKLYIYLKINSDGEIYYYERSFNEWAEKLHINYKTIKNSLEWLIKNKWITVNSKKHTLKIISYQRLGRRLHFDSKSGYLFESNDYKDFKALCCGVVITHYLNRKRYFNRRSVNLKGFAMIKNRKKGFYPMANKYISTSIGVSLSTAYRYKNEAEKAHYIKTISDSNYMEDSNGNKIASDNYLIFKKNGEENKIRQGKNYLKEISSDLIHSNIKLKRKNIKFYNEKTEKDIRVL